MSDSSINFASKPVALRQAIESNGHWIERELGVPLSECVVIEVDLDLTQIGAERHLGFDDPDATPTRTLRRLRTLLADTAIPHARPLVLEMTRGISKDNLSEILGDKPKNMPGFHWGDCPIALRFHLRGLILIALNVSFHDGPAASYESEARFIIARRDFAPYAISMLTQIGRRDRQPRIRVQDGPARPIVPCNWEDLVLGENILSLVRNDFERFFTKRSWFRRNRLPFRRGYLLYGPPGNGKTTVIRAMLSSRGLTAHTLRFFDMHKDDSDLERLFQEACKDRPSIVLLEDIDRAFPISGNSKSNISLQQLLNCLDGLATPEGIIVVATANDATTLDPAILKRPGRFDRVVYFPNPGSELRLQYLRKINPGVDVSTLTQIVAESEGMSFAQLREVTILAAQYAFDRNEDAMAEDLLRGVRILRQTNTQSSTNSKSTGFAH